MLTTLVLANFQLLSTTELSHRQHASLLRICMLCHSCRLSLESTALNCSSTASLWKVSCSHQSINILVCCSQHVTLLWHSLNVFKLSRHVKYISRHVCIAESPLMISVVDAQLISFSGPMLVPVRKLATLKANTEAAGKAKLIATMTCKLISLH